MLNTQKESAVKFCLCNSIVELLVCKKVLSSKEAEQVMMQIQNKSEDIDKAA